MEISIMSTNGTTVSIPWSNAAELMTQHIADHTGLSVYHIQRKIMTSMDMSHEEYDTARADCIRYANDISSLGPVIDMSITGNGRRIVLPVDEITDDNYVSVPTSCTAQLLLSYIDVATCELTAR